MCIIILGWIFQSLQLWSSGWRNFSLQIRPSATDRPLLPLPPPTTTQICGGKERSVIDAMTSFGILGHWRPPSRRCRDTKSSLLRSIPLLVLACFCSTMITEDNLPRCLGYSDFSWRRLRVTSSLHDLGIFSRIGVRFFLRSRVNVVGNVQNHTFHFNKIRAVWWWN